MPRLSWHLQHQCPISKMLFKFWLSCCSFSSLLMCLWRPRRVTYVVRTLPLTWETWVKLLAPGFSHQWMKDSLSLSFCLPLSFMYIILKGRERTFGVLLKGHSRFSNIAHFLSVLFSFNSPAVFRGADIFLPVSKMEYPRTLFSAILDVFWMNANLVHTARLSPCPTSPTLNPPDASCFVPFCMWGNWKKKFTVPVSSPWASLMTLKRGPRCACRLLPWAVVQDCRHFHAVCGQRGEGLGMKWVSYTCGAQPGPGLS